VLTGSPHAGSVPVVLLLLLLLLLLRLIVAEMRGRVNVGRLALRAGLSRQSLLHRLEPRCGRSRGVRSRRRLRALDLVEAHLAPLVPLLSPANVAHFHLAVTELDNCRRTPLVAHIDRPAALAHTEVEVSGIFRRARPRRARLVPADRRILVKTHLQDREAGVRV
jgi:hypothetical protein